VPNIRRWYSSGACSLAPHILLHEIGLPFDAVETSFAKAAHVTDEFARINPKKRLPVLSLDGEVITEVSAIAAAVAHLAPERHLMGKTALDRVRVYEWMNWLSGTLHGQGFAGLWRPERFSDDPAAFDSIRARGRRTILECFQLIESRVAPPIQQVAAALAAEGISGQSLKDQPPPMDTAPRAAPASKENVS